MKAPAGELLVHARDVARALEDRSEGADLDHLAAQLIRELAGAVRVQARRPWATVELLSPEELERAAARAEAR